MKKKTIEIKQEEVSDIKFSKIRKVNFVDVTSKVITIEIEEE